jgi:hypothetical protein
MINLFCARPAVALGVVAMFCALEARAAKLPVLIVDGRNNHDWRATTDALRATLESTGPAVESQPGSDDVHAVAVVRQGASYTKAKRRTCGTV